MKYRLIKAAIDAGTVEMNTACTAASEEICKAQAAGAQSEPDAEGPQANSNGQQ